MLNVCGQNENFVLHASLAIEQYVCAVSALNPELYHVRYKFHLKLLRGMTAYCYIKCLSHRASQELISCYGSEID